MHLIHRKTCCVCGSSALVKVIDLGEQCLQGSFIKIGKEEPPRRKISTALVRCDPTQDENACGLLQTETSVPPTILYYAYWYRSGTNLTMRNHLKDIVNNVCKFIDKSNAVVLDIGCNDGTLLSYYPDGFDKFGIDPSDITKTINGDITVVQDVFPSEELNTKAKGKKFDIITSIAMFYDLEDPVNFVKSIRDNLSLNGVWVVEMSYMPSMLRLNSYDTICHEHLEYYSFATIENILSRVGMKVFKVELNTINGGSIRCYATHISNFKFSDKIYLNDINKIRQEEFDLALDTDEPYLKFQERANIHRDKLFKILLQVNIIQ